MNKQLLLAFSYFIDSRQGKQKERWERKEGRKETDWKENR